MRRESVCKVIAVLLLLTGQPLLTKSATSGERPIRDPSSTDATLKRVRRTLIGTGGGGIPENQPPIPFPVEQNMIITQPSFVLTFRYGSNGQSAPTIKLTGPPVTSNNAKSAPTIKLTRPPVTSSSPNIKQQLTTKPPTFRALPTVGPKVVPKLEPKSTTGYTTPASESTTPPNFPSRFRKLPKNKSKNKEVDALNTPDNEDVAAMVEGTDNPTEADFFVEPMDRNEQQANEAEINRMEDPEEETDIVDDLNPFNPEAGILSRVKTSESDPGPLTMNKVRQKNKQKKDKNKTKNKKEKKSKNT